MTVSAAEIFGGPIWSPVPGQTDPMYTHIYLSALSRRIRLGRRLNATTVAVPLYRGAIQCLVGGRKNAAAVDGRG
jgi:hypothetical protein